MNPAGVNSFDIIIVGSGPSGAQSAETLCSTGMRVALLDVGNFDSEYAGRIPAASFTEIRQKLDDQIDFFLGTKLEGLGLGGERLGTQMTPPRKFVVSDSDKLLPIESVNFNTLQSLAYGGLGAGWGAGCFVMSESELSKMGIPAEPMNEAYETVARRIGVSGDKNDSCSYSNLGNLATVQPASRLDRNCETLLTRYFKNEKKLNAKGIYLGRPALALLTENLGGREATKYRDMDFWSNEESSVYRPWMTIQKLRTEDKLTYVPRAFVLKYEETNDGVNVTARDLSSGKLTVYSAKSLFLSAGALVTPRIVANSSNQTGSVSTPILSNPSHYTAAINLNMIGETPSEDRSSLVQLTMCLDPNRTNDGAPSASIYGYRSLLLFKLIRESPLSSKDGFELFKRLQTCLIIGIINLSDSPSELKRLTIETSSDRQDLGTAKIRYQMDDEEKKNYRTTHRKFQRALLNIRCIPLKGFSLGSGASLRYAGTLPYDDQGGAMTTRTDGRLNGTRSVYIVDSSPFRYLPAKGMAFTIMANAHRVAREFLATRGLK